MVGVEEQDAGVRVFGVVVARLLIDLPPHRDAVGGIPEELLGAEHEGELVGVLLTPLEVQTRHHPQQRLLVEVARPQADAIVVRPLVEARDRGDIPGLLVGNTIVDDVARLGGGIHGLGDPPLPADPRRPIGPEEVVLLLHAPACGDLAVMLLILVERHEGLLHRELVGVFVGLAAHQPVIVQLGPAGVVAQPARRQPGIGGSLVEHAGDLPHQVELRVVAQGELGTTADVGELASLIGRLGTSLGIGGLLGTRQSAGGREDSSGKQWQFPHLIVPQLHRVAPDSGLIAPSRPGVAG